MQHIKGTVCWVGSAVFNTLGVLDIDKSLNRGCMVLGAVLSVLGIISYWYNIREKRQAIKKAKQSRFS